MPQDNDTSIISFSVPKKDDSLATTNRIIHVAVVKPKVMSDTEIIVTPLMILFPVACILLLVLNELKSNKKTAALWSKLERIATRAENDTEM